MKLINSFLLAASLLIANASFAQQHHPSANELMKNNMMRDSIMMVIANDPQLMHKMMETMMARAEKDSTMCQDMMSMMMHNPKMHQRMMGMMQAKNMKGEMKQEDKKE